MATDKARPKARLPRGFADRGPAEIRRVAAMTETIRGVYERWGFEPVETPLIEYADALGKFLPDQDRPNEGVFAFEDDDGQWLSLRYDLTAPLARMVAENFERTPKPYKSYRAGWVFRNEKPGPGRFRQFMQFDADIVGSASPLADAEICMMAADTMEALGFSRGEYVIRVSSRGVIDAILDRILQQPTAPATRLGILRALDKFDKFDALGVIELLTRGRMDESGDRTPGVGLTYDQAHRILRALGMWQRDEAIADTIDRRRSVHNAMHATGLVDTPFQEPDLESNIFAVQLIEWQQYEHGESAPEISHLRSIAEIVGAAGYDRDRVVIDPSVVRGLEYYTGAVFEAELTFPTPDENGRPVRFGSVGGGGRYDGLVGRFRGEDVPATGFSVGVSRLAAALDARDAGRAARGPVVVTVMDKAEIARYQALTQRLRDALNPPGAPPVPVEMYVGTAGMKAQLKYADRRDAVCVIIRGSDEVARNVVQIKDLAAGAEAAQAIGSREDWVAARPAQREVAYDGTDVSHIAAAVREILRR